MREAGLCGVFHSHLLRCALQGLVVTACSISSTGIGTMLVFVKCGAQKLLVLELYRFPQELSFFRCLFRAQPWMDGLGNLFMAGF